MVPVKPRDITATDGRVLKEFISDENEVKSLLIFPEEASTNGKYALLRYTTRYYIIIHIWAAGVLIIFYVLSKCQIDFHHYQLL